MNKVCIITGFDSKTDRCAVGQYTDRLKASLSVTPNSSVEKLNLRSRSLFRWLGALKRAFSQNQVVHLQYPLEAWGTSVWPGLLPGLFRLFYRKTRLVVTFHEWGSTHPLRKLSMVPTAFFADCIVSVSRHVQKEVLDDSLIRARPRKLKSAFIPVGSNIQVLQPEAEVSQAIRSLYRRSSDTKLIGYFGFLYGWKQPYKLLELAKAMKERGEDVRFLIIGDFPVDHVQQKQAYLDYIREHKLDDVVEMVGFVPSEFELSNWLGACDGVVQLFADGLTVRRSSFWTVLNLGVPLITTRPTSTKEFTGLVSLEHLQTDGQLYLVEPSIDLDEVMEGIRELRPYQLPCAMQQSPDWEMIASQHRDLYACVSKEESASSLQNSECAIGRET